MNIKDLYVGKENFKKGEKYKVTKGEKIDSIISGVMTGIMIASLIVTPTLLNNGNDMSYASKTPVEISQEKQTENSANILIDVINTDSIEDASITIIDSNNVVAAYITVEKEGIVGNNKMLLYPDEDYKIIINNNGQTKEVDFHTYSDKDTFKLFIDYANGSINLDKVEKPRIM